MGLRLQDMYSRVVIALAIEREMDEAQGIRDAIAGGKRKEDQPSSSLGLEVKASGKSLWENSPLGSRVRVGQIW